MNLSGNSIRRIVDDLADFGIEGYAKRALQNHQRHGTPLTAAAAAEALAALGEDRVAELGMAAGALSGISQSMDENA